MTSVHFLNEPNNVKRYQTQDKIVPHNLVENADMRHVGPIFKSLKPENHRQQYEKGSVMTSYA